MTRSDHPGGVIYAHGEDMWVISVARNGVSTDYGATGDSPIAALCELVARLSASPGPVDRDSYIAGFRDARRAATPRTEALDAAIENFLATPRPPSANKDGIYAYELALSRLRIAYGVYKGYLNPCPVPSSVTGQPCLLPDGHPQDSATRFHRYPRATPRTEASDE